MLRRRAVAAAGAVIVAAFVLAATALADGLPTPLPDASAGPDQSVIQLILASYGLDCQPDQSFDGVAEWFCLRQAGSDGLTYSATYYADPALVMVATVSGPTPFGSEADTFLHDLAVAFCPPTDPVMLSAFMAGDIPVPPPSPGLPAILEGDTCRLEINFLRSPGRANELLMAFWRGPAFLPSPSVVPFPSPSPFPTLPTIAPPPIAAPTPTPGPSATATPPKSTPPPQVVESVAGPPSGPGGFYESIPAPSAVSTDPIILAESLALAALVVLLMPFPAQLFNSTLETHYAEVRRWFRLDRIHSAAGRFAGFWDSAVGILVFIVLSAVIYAALDPGVGIDAESLAQILGLALGLVATTMIASVTGILRSREDWHLRALPATLLIGLACVIISRVTGFLPGYIYGIILGVVLGRSLSRMDQGRANAIAAGIMLAVALSSWILLAVVTGTVTGLVGIVFSTLLATVLVACLEGVVFGLLPFRFLPGEPLFATSRLAWAALLGLGAFAFFHILINPASGYLSSTSRTPFFTIVGLFVGFAALSIVFWAYFRDRPVQE